MSKLDLIADVRQTVKKQVRNKTRKSLQTLQLNSEEVRKNMICTNEKNFPVKEKKYKVNETVIATEKENAPILRRSKRKPIVTGTATPTDEPKQSKSSTKNPKAKSKKTVSKSKKGNSTSVNKNQQKTNLSQSKLNFSYVKSASSKSDASPKKDICEIDESENIALENSILSEVTEDSGFVPCAGTSQQINESENIALENSILSEVTEDSGFLPCAGTSQQISPSIVFKSPCNTAATCSSDNSILTMGSPPESYWKDLAEQRRIALEKALHENELLHDQLEVLEAENSQLKQLVKEAEELAKVVKGIIE